MPEETIVAETAIAEWVDAVELWAEDRDAWAWDNLNEATRYIFDDVPLVSLLQVLPL